MLVIRKIPTIVIVVPGKCSRLSCFGPLPGRRAILALMDMIAWHRDDVIAIRVSYLTGKVVIALKINTRIEYFNFQRYGKYAEIRQIGRKDDVNNMVVWWRS